MKITSISKNARAEARARRARDVAALHAMQAARPLVAARHNFGERRRNSAAAEARKDRERGFGL